MQADIMVMSGADDGKLVSFDIEEGDGTLNDDAWTLRIGRHTSNDLHLEHDSFVSRHHASLHWQGGWWLEDHGSKNGCYIQAEPLESIPVTEPVSIKPGALFCVGQTWLRIQPYV